MPNPTPPKTRSAARRWKPRTRPKLIHSTEKSLKDYGDKVSEADRTAISDAIAALKTASEASEPDADDIKAKTQTLMEVSMKLGQAIYEAQQAEGGAAADASAEGGDNVVDADYEEIKDDDRKKSA